MQYNYLENNGQKFVKMIEEIEADIYKEDFKSAEKKADAFNKLWMEAKPKYEMLCEHFEVDKIQSCVEQFNVLLDQQDPFVFTQTSLLKYYLNHIVDIDSFAFENIF